MSDEPPYLRQCVFQFVREHWRALSMAFGNIATLIVLTATLNAYKESNRISKENFDIARSVWMAPEGMLYDAKSPTNSILYFRFKNTSMTPALHVSCSIQQVGPDDKVYPIQECDGYAVWFPETEQTFQISQTGDNSKGVHQLIDDGNISFNVILTYHDICGRKVVYKENEKMWHSHPIMKDTSLEYEGYITK